MIYYKNRPYGNIPADDSLSTTSINSVQNKVVTTALEGKIEQCSIMPSPSADYVNTIVYYSGSTTSSYKKGDFYCCIREGSTYKWEKISYNKEEIDALLFSITSYKVVSTLPTTDIRTNIIYLVSNTSDDIKEMYVNTTGTTTGWEKVGDTSVNLEDYIKLEDLETITTAEIRAALDNLNY